MGKFVDQQQSRATRERSVEIELVHDLVAVDDRLAWQDFEAVDELLGLAPAMRFDQPGNDIAAAQFLGAAGAEHGIGLPDPGSGAEKNFQVSPPFLFGQGEERVRRGSLLCVGGHSPPLAAAIYDFRSSSARLSLSTLTRGSPSRPKVRPSVRLSTSSRTRASGRLRAFAPRGT